MEYIVMKWLFYISIHAAREGGDSIRKKFILLFDISIHAAREGGDALPYISIIIGFGFQSTPPVKAATQFPPL